MSHSPLQEKLDTFISAEWTGEKRIHGLKGSSRAYLLSLLAERTKRPTLLVAPTTKEAEVLYQDLAFFLGEEEALSPIEKRLHIFPSWDVLPFETLSPHLELVAARLEGLYHLIEGRAPILVSTPAALLQRVIPKDDLKKSYRYLVVGEEISREHLLEHLIGWGFQSVPLVEERGDLSVRGGIVDIFPPAYPRPMRLEFSADNLESIREFDPSTQRSVLQHQELILLPRKEFSLRSNQIKGILRDIEERAEELDLVSKQKNSLLESLRSGTPFMGMEFLAPYFYPKLVPLFSYLPPESLLWLDQESQLEEEVERYEKLVWQRGAKAKEEGHLHPPSGKDCT